MTGHPLDYLKTHLKLSKVMETRAKMVYNIWLRKVIVVPILMIRPFRI